jgi:drug/metabolite transporter (DMT)-like permease
LISLVLIWAISWPVIKVGIAVVPPIWFGCLRYLIAAACLCALVAARKQLIVPSRADWPLVAVSGALQMAAYSALTGIALTILPPGRASVLAFSTPLWVVPLAAWRLDERISRLAILGVGVGLVGILIIAAPSLRSGGYHQIAAYAMLMGAAGAWAITIIFVRSHRFAASALMLAPWQMLFAAMLLLPVALVAEGPMPAINASGIFSLVYVAPVATAFAYWAIVEVGRRFRASTISMALLATPSLGILISTATLGEPISASLVAGVAFTAVGIRLVTGQRHER